MSTDTVRMIATYVGFPSSVYLRLRGFGFELDTAYKPLDIDLIDDKFYHRQNDDRVFITYRGFNFSAVYEDGSVPQEREIMISYVGSAEMWERITRRFPSELDSEEP